MCNIVKAFVTAGSGVVGWFIGKFEPTFPLILVALAFILWDVQSAWELDKRVHKVYPHRVKSGQAKFISFKLGRVVRTIVHSGEAILLMYALRRWVFHEIWDVPLDYMATAIVCGWQLLSVLENNASCPLEGDRKSKIWTILREVLIDKTERHFDVVLDKLKESEDD